MLLRVVFMIFMLLFVDSCASHHNDVVEDTNLQSPETRASIK